MISLGLVSATVVSLGDGGCGCGRACGSCTRARTWRVFVVIALYQCCFWRPRGDEHESRCRSDDRPCSSERFAAASLCGWSSDARDHNAKRAGGGRAAGGVFSMTASSLTSRVVVDAAQRPKEATGEISPLSRGMQQRRCADEPSVPPGRPCQQQMHGHSDTESRVVEESGRGLGEPGVATPAPSVRCTPRCFVSCRRCSMELPSAFVELVKTSRESHFR